MKNYYSVGCFDEQVKKINESFMNQIWK